LGKLLPYSIKSLHDLSILILVFSLPFFHKFSTVAIVLVLLPSLIEIIDRREFPSIRMHWFLPVLYFYYVISELVSGGTAHALEKRHMLILIPLAVALNENFNSGQLRNRIFKSFIVANLLAVLIMAGRALVRSVALQDGDWIFNPKVIHDTNHDFLTSSVMGGNYFFAEDFSFFQHPTYAGIQLVFAQYLIFELFGYAKKKERIGLVVVYFVFQLGLFLLSSKAAIITSLLVAFWILFRLNINLFAKVASLAGCAVLCMLFVFFNPRLRVFIDTFSVAQLTHPDPNARFGHDVRILSWDASMDVIKANWLVGVGEAHKTPVLVDVYTHKGYVVPAEQQLNSHNQSLEFLVGGGIVAFGIFAAGILTLGIMGIRAGDYVFLTFLAIVVFNSLFESLLERHAAILFFAVFVSLLANRRQSLS